MYPHFRFCTSFPILCSHNEICSKNNCPVSERGKEMYPYNGRNQCVCVCLCVCVCVNKASFVYNPVIFILSRP